MKRRPLQQGNDRSNVGVKVTLVKAEEHPGLSGLGQNLLQSVCVRGMHCRGREINKDLTLKEEKEKGDS